jgi:transcriptional regulator with XRE-family HTH domain
LEAILLDFKDKIKQLRNEKGLTTYKLSQIMTSNGFKISQSAISKIENGNKKIDYDTLQAIAKALNVNIADITDNPEINKIEESLNEAIRYIKAYLEDSPINDTESYNKFGVDGQKFLKSTLDLLIRHLNNDPKILEPYSKIIELINAYDKDLDNLHNDPKNRIDYKSFNNSQDYSIKFDKINHIPEKDENLLQKIKEILPDINKTYKLQQMFYYAVNNGIGLK